MSSVFPLGAKVCFTQELLSVLTARDRNGLAGRVGVVQTDGTQVSKPTVYFSADAGRPEIRLFRVDPRQLELVENPPESAAAVEENVRRWVGGEPLLGGVSVADGY